MEKVTKDYDNFIKNTEAQKNSLSINYEYQDGNVTLRRIGNEISIVSPLVCSKLQQKVANALIRHLKNSDAEFSKRFHKVVTDIINDPTSNAGKKIAKNGWFAQDLSQKDLKKKYKKVYKATSKLLK